MTREQMIAAVMEQCDVTRKQALKLLERGQEQCDQDEQGYNDDDLIDMACIAHNMDATDDPYDQDDPTPM